MVKQLLSARWPRLHFTPQGEQRLGEVMCFLNHLHERQHPQAEDIETEFHRQLEYLDAYGGTVNDTDPRRRFKVTLGQDWSTLSFSVTWERLDTRNGEYGFGMCGGLIWHGGNNAPLTITLTPCWWGLHT